MAFSPRSAAAFQFAEHLEKFLARHPHELFEHLDFGALGLQRRAPFGGGAQRFQFLDVPQARLEFFVDVARHDDHFLDDLLFVEKPGKHFLQLEAEFLQLALQLFLAALLQGLLPGKILRVHLLVERVDFLDELAQIAQMAFAIGDFLVHNHAVEPFLRRLGQQFFRDGDVFLRGEAEAVNDALHLDLGLFDALANFDFLFAREQRDLAHLVHIHADRVVENFQTRVLVRFLLLRGFGLPGAFGLGLVHDDFHVETAQFGQQRVQILRTEIVRQNVIDVVVSDVAVLLREVEQRLDRLGQIHGRLTRWAPRGHGRWAAIFARRPQRDWPRAAWLFRWFPAVWTASRRAMEIDKTPPRRGRFCSCAAPAAMLALARGAG